MVQTWQSYEEVATYLLNKFASDFGLSRVESKQSLSGVNSSTSWEIDAKGFRQGNDGFVIVECRRYTNSKQNQEKVASLAYRISDTGAVGGIVVSPLGLQKGAKLIAGKENIIDVKLHPKSTSTEFSMQFLNKIFLGILEQVNASDNCEAILIRICVKCRKSFLVKDNEKICYSCSSLL